MGVSFNHEKLKVYQDSILFVAAISVTLENIPRKYCVRDQLDRASTSIPLNIAEGNGKYTSKDKCRFLDISKGSAMECAACIDILVSKGLINPEEARPLKTSLYEIVGMLIGLIRTISPDRQF